LPPQNGFGKSRWKSLKLTVFGFETGCFQLDLAGAFQWWNGCFPGMISWEKVPSPAQAFLLPKERFFGNCFTIVR